MRTRGIETTNGRNRLPVGLLIVALAMALAPRAAAGGTTLESAWRSSGAIGEEKAPVAVPFENGRVSVAVSNDDRYLYFSLITRDRALIDSMYRNGMTLWVDPKGGRREFLGIRYPIGIEGDPVSELRGQGGRRTPPSSVPPDQWLEIVGSGEDTPRRVALGTIPGLDVRMRESGDDSIYEARLPLITSEDRSLVVGAAAGGTIGVGWKTDREKSPDTPPSGGGRPGGMGGGSHHGGSHGGAGGAGGAVPREEHSGAESEGGGAAPKPLRLWLRVRLAAAEPSRSTSLEGD